jgi:hypothetical protein
MTGDVVNKGLASSSVMMASQPLELCAKMNRSGISAILGTDAA